MLTLDEFKDDYDRKQAFEVSDKCSATLGSTVSVEKPTIASVTRVIADSPGENDGPAWLFVVELADGRFAFVDASCDYTGWDCQAGGSIIVSGSLDDLVRYGLTDEARDRLGM